MVGPWMLLQGAGNTAGPEVLVEVHENERTPLITFYGRKTVIHGGKQQIRNPILLAKWFDLPGKPLRISLNQGAAQCRHVTAARAAGDVSQATLGPR